MPRMVDLILGDGSRQSYDIPDTVSPEEEEAQIQAMRAKRDWLIPLRRKIIDSVVQLPGARPGDPYQEIPGARAILDTIMPRSEEEAVALVATGALGGPIGTGAKALAAEGSVVSKVAPTLARGAFAGLVAGSVAHQRGLEAWKARSAEIALGQIFGETVAGMGGAVFKNIGAQIPKKISDAWATEFGTAIHKIFPNAKTVDDLAELFNSGMARKALRGRLDDYDAQIFAQLKPTTTMSLPVIKEINEILSKLDRIKTLNPKMGDDVLSFEDAFKSARTLRSVRKDLIDQGHGARAGRLLDNIKIYEEELERRVVQFAPEAAALMRARLRESRQMYAVADFVEGIPGLIESGPGGARFRMDKVYHTLGWRNSPGGASARELLSEAGLDDVVAALYPRGYGPGYGVGMWEVGAPFVRGRVGAASIGERIPVQTGIRTYPGGPPGPRGIPRTVAGMAGQRAVVTGAEAFIPGTGPGQRQPGQ